MNNDNVSKNFNLNEFKVSKDHPELASKIVFSPMDIMTIRVLALECLQPIRDSYGSIQILSGKRSAELNTAVGGAKDSDHLTANAADIVSLDSSLLAVMEWIVNKSGIPYRQVIYYPNEKFIHISCNIPGKAYKHEAFTSINGKYVGYNAAKK